MNVKNIFYHILRTIRRHVSVAAATIIRVSFKNANNVQQLHKMEKEIKEKNNSLISCYL